MNKLIEFWKKTAAEGGIRIGWYWFTPADCLRVVAHLELTQ